MRELLILPQYQRFIKFPLHRPITSTTNGLEKKGEGGFGYTIRVRDGYDFQKIVHVRNIIK